MDRTKYFEYLRDAGLSVSPMIRSFIDEFSQVDRHLFEAVKRFAEGRLDKPLMKPALITASYESCGGECPDSITPAAAAFELINISSYQANSAFDNKLGVLGRSEKDTQFMTSMLSREAATRLCCELDGDFSQDTIHALQRSISRSNHHIYLAQHLDLNVLTAARCDAMRSEKEFLELYVRRCYWGSGIINGECALAGALLAETNGSTKEAIRRFGASFGTALQIVNDVGDYVPPDPSDLISRTFQDQYSDLRNGRLTLPLYHLLRISSDRPERIAEMCSIENVRALGRGELREVSQAMIEYGSFDFARSLARQWVERAKGELNLLADNNGRRILSVMTSMILHNKYFSAIRALRRTG